MGKKLQSLKVGTELDTYHIEKILGGGGFSIVYLASDQVNGQKVVIKEYMPGKIAYRVNGHDVEPSDENFRDTFVQGRKAFFKEASILATLKHPNIVSVINFFQAHGTVYMVMEYEEGANLQSYIRSRRGNLSEKFLRTVFPMLLQGLKAIHSKGVLHLDIKPGNIHLRPGGRPLLLDFGAVHMRWHSRKDQVSQIITPGFSPMEQYDPNGYVGPWTDIYALGATMRACIEGISPQPANLRQEKDYLKPAVSLFKKRYSVTLLEAIDWAMEMDPLLRPQIVDEFLQTFDSEDLEQADTETVLDKLVTNFPWIK
jgi:serine/threonine protein kinase